METSYWFRLTGRCSSVNKMNRGNNTGVLGPLHTATTGALLVKIECQGAGASLGGFWNKAASDRAGVGGVELYKHLY